MASYEVLYGKYQRALASVRDLEKQKEFYANELDSLRESTVQLDKNTRTLCETILKKDRELNKEKKDKNDVWFRKNTIELIKLAQESLEKYFPSIEGMLQQLLERANERSLTISKLQNQIKENDAEAQKKYSEMEEKKDKVIQELRNQLASGNCDKEVVEKIIEKGKNKPTDLNTLMDSFVEIEEEESDDLGSEVAEAAEVMFEQGEIPVPLKKGPKVIMSGNSKKKIKEKIDKVADSYTKEIEAYIKKINELQKYIIQVMGETGISELAPLIVEARRRNPDIPSDSRIKTAIYGLRNGISVKEGKTEQIIESISCPVPGSANLSLYKLSRTGRDIYKYIYEKEAIEPEMDVIKKHHSTLEHGYGIKKTAQLINEMEYIKTTQAEVLYLTRRKAFSVQLSDGSFYIPDIIIVSRNKEEKEIRRYIEYETGQCTESDFMNKCNKIADFSAYLNFIVPNNEIKEKLIRQTDKWKESIKQEWPSDKIDVYHIRVGTFKELQGGNSKYGIPWPPETTIRKYKKKK